MITRIFSVLVNGVIYFLAASLLSQIVLGAYLWKAWKMDENTAMRMLAVAQGIDLLARPEQGPADGDPSAEQASMDQIIKERAGQLRDIEKREQELNNGKTLFLAEQQGLVRDQDSFAAIRADFYRILADMEEGALKDGRTRDQRIYAGIKAKQAKDLLMGMLDAGEIEDVVILWASIPDMKKFKIAAEFKTPVELEELAKVNKLIRYGEPEINNIEDTLGKLSQPAL